MEWGGGALGGRWVGRGVRLGAGEADVAWGAKGRDGGMREYVASKGAMAVDMMRRTCTVQANLDYSDETDAFTKLRVSLRATPIFSSIHTL